MMKQYSFYTQKLHFNLIEDTVLSKEKRWIVVAPKGANTCAMLLTKAANEEHKTRIGNQTGGRVFLFLYTDDFWRDYKNMFANKSIFKHVYTCSEIFPPGLF